MDWLYIHECLVYPIERQMDEWPDNKLTDGLVDPCEINVLASP